MSLAVAHRRRLRLAAAALLGVASGATLQSTAAAADEAGLTAGGFARLHVLAGDISADRDRPGDIRLHIPSIPVDGRPDSDSNRTSAHVQDSRLWMRAVTQTRLGRVEALVEGDLAGAADKYDPRLRHAYLIVGRLLVGQTWSVFTNTSSLADIDAGYAVGNIITRRRQIRWEQPLDAATTFTAALEDPRNQLHLASSGRINSSGDDRRPDLVMRLGRAGAWGNVSLSMAVREIATIDPPLPGTGTDSRTGTAFSLAGRLATGVADNLRFAFSYGNALSRYLTSNTYADATITPEGTVDPSTTHSGLVAWQHFWSTELRSTFAVSYSRTDAHRSSSDNLTREARSGHANLIWTPTPRFSFGIEYLYGWRETIGGGDGDVNRLQFTSRLNF